MVAGKTAPAKPSKVASSASQMRNLERVEREDVAVRPVGRPRSAVAAPKAGNFEGHEIAVELARPGPRRRCRSHLPQGCAYRAGRRRPADGQSAREVELRWQIGIGHADGEAFRSRRRSGPGESRRHFVLLGKTLRDDGPGGISGAAKSNSSSSSACAAGDVSSGR